MKLITRDPDQTYLDRLKRRLEENGIPAFVAGDNVARVVPLRPLTEAGLWIYLDSQYDDAVRLSADPDYRVRTGIDVAAFYRSQPDKAAGLRQLNAALIHIALVVIGISAALFLLAWILTRL